MRAERVAATARVKESIRKWWDSVPEKNRKAEYGTRFFVEKFNSNSTYVGPALKTLGWVQLRQRNTPDGYVRRWTPPGSKATGALANVHGAEAPEIMRVQLEELRKQVKLLSKENVTDQYVKEKIFGLKESELVIPDWLVNPPKSVHAPGVPTLFASDWHWGEIVFPTQINGVNEYNLAIAHARAKLLIERAIDLLTNHMVNPSYPGIVFALGGDMVSGDIHEELMATNEMEIMAIAVDIIGVLIWCIKTLADKFGFVFVPCVGGNHGRITHKIRAKGRNFTSVDWLIYQMLKMHFQNDKRVTFYVPDGSDAHYRVYGHRYLLTHGDQFRGGDGMIGALGPILRGDHKKRSRNSQIGMEYDTMIIGHWHQLIQLQRLIVNGSLKGYDEYAYTSNFPFEPARQGLWLTHPQHGITFSIPVFVDAKPQQKLPQTDWVSVPGNK